MDNGTFWIQHVLALGCKIPSSKAVSQKLMEFLGMNLHQVTRLRFFPRSSWKPQVVKGHKEPKEERMKGWCSNITLRCCWNLPSLPTNSIGGQSLSARDLIHYHGWRSVISSHLTDEQSEAVGRWEETEKMISVQADPAPSSLALGHSCLRLSDRETALPSRGQEGLAERRPIALLVEEIIMLGVCLSAIFEWQAWIS